MSRLLLSLSLEYISIKNTQAVPGRPLQGSPAHEKSRQLGLGAVHNYQGLLFYMLFVDFYYLPTKIITLLLWWTRTGWGLKILM